MADPDPQTFCQVCTPLRKVKGHTTFSGLILCTECSKLSWFEILVIIFLKTISFDIQRMANQGETKQMRSIFPGIK